MLHVWEETQPPGPGLLSLGALQDEGAKGREKGTTVIGLTNYP